MEYIPLARALSIGWPYGLGTVLLASLYQSMGKYVSELPYQRVGLLFGLYRFGSLLISLSYQVLTLFPPCL